MPTIPCTNVDSKDTVDGRNPAPVDLVNICEYM